MIWLHEKVYRHRVRRKSFPVVKVPGGEIPKHLLVSCSCGRIWTRR